MTAAVHPQTGVGPVMDDARRERENDLRRPKFILMAITIVVLVNGMSSGFVATQWWRSAVFATALNVSLIVSYIYYYDDRKMMRWLALLVVAGFVELIADWWLVDVTGTLIYGPNMPKIWRSPAYMPLAWAGVLVQVTALGYWGYNVLLEKWRSPAKAMMVASLLTGVVGGVNIPLYEHFARRAEWWVYVDTPMLITNSPYYIMLGELLLCLPLVWMARHVAKSTRWFDMVGLGVVAGLGIWLAYFVAFALTGNCGGAFAVLFDHAVGCGV